MMCVEAAGAADDRVRGMSFPREMTEIVRQVALVHTAVRSSAGILAQTGGVCVLVGWRHEADGLAEAAVCVTWRR